jgi:hypothetical protein
MSEEPYSKREIDNFMVTIHEKLDDISSDTKEIKEQTTKTNGRVNKHDMYFKFAWWVLGALWALILIATPVMLHVVKNSIKDTVSSQLEDYIFELE